MHFSVNKQMRSATKTDLSSHNCRHKPKTSCYGTETPLCEKNHHIETFADKIIDDGAAKHRRFSSGQLQRSITTIAAASQKFPPFEPEVIIRKITFSGFSEWDEVLKGLTYTSVIRYIDRRIMNTERTIRKNAFATR